MKPPETLSPETQPLKINSRNYQQTFLALLAVWFLVNFLQAAFTEILPDEAYYYLYGQHLAWGYFDHPPMIALLIRFSSLLFYGNLGVRFMTVVLQPGTLWITWKMIEDQKPERAGVTLFFILAASICLFAAYGFISTPDVPLLFFTALFLYAYKRFLGQQDMTALALLMVSMAGLVYSKYHGILVIGFVVLSNFRLLKDYRFWIAGLAALILLSPHIYWQFQNDFPDLKYHLVVRAKQFNWLYFLEYLPNQLAVFNPFILLAAIFLIFKFKPADLFMKALYYQVIGFLGFFWLMTYRGHVEPHWNIACSIPMIIILYSGIHSGRVSLKYVRSFILPSLGLILLARILLVTSLPPVRWLGFSGKEEKYKFIESEAGTLPVVFSGSFSDPSLYRFFTGREAMALSNLYTRQTQFDLWQLESKYLNKPVFLVGFHLPGSVIYKNGDMEFEGFKTDSLQATNGITIEFDMPERTLHPGDSISLSIRVKNPCEYTLDFNHPRFPVILSPVFAKKSEGINVLPARLSVPIGLLRNGESLKRILKFSVPELGPGEYSFCVSLNSWLGPTYNSNFVRVKVENGVR